MMAMGGRGGKERVRRGEDDQRSSHRRQRERAAQAEELVREEPAGQEHVGGVPDELQVARQRTHSPAPLGPGGGRVGQLDRARLLGDDDAPARPDDRHGAIDIV